MKRTNPIYYALNIFFPLVISRILRIRSSCYFGDVNQYNDLWGEVTDSNLNGIGQRSVATTSDIAPHFPSLGVIIIALSVLAVVLLAAITGIIVRMRQK